MVVFHFLQHVATRQSVNRRGLSFDIAFVQLVEPKSECTARMCPLSFCLRHRAGAFRHFSVSYPAGAYCALVRLPLSKSFHLVVDAMLSVNFSFCSKAKSSRQTQSQRQIKSLRGSENPNRRSFTTVPTLLVWCLFGLFGLFLEPTLCFLAVKRLPTATIAAEFQFQDDPSYLLSRLTCMEFVQSHNHPIVSSPSFELCRLYSLKQSNP